MDDADNAPGTIDASPAEMSALLESAWGIIANAGWDGMAKTDGWQEAAVRWRDRYLALLGVTMVPSEEDRIRDAMAEAQAHPGRVVTR
jgi:hypothetical protein